MSTCGVKPVAAVGRLCGSERFGAGKNENPLAEELLLGSLPRLARTHKKRKENSTMSEAGDLLMVGGEESDRARRWIKEAVSEMQPIAAAAGPGCLDCQDLATGPCACEKPAVQAGSCSSKFLTTALVHMTRKEKPKEKMRLVPESEEHSGEPVSCQERARASVIRAAVRPKVDKESCQSASMRLSMDECIAKGKRDRLLSKAPEWPSKWEEKEAVEAYLRCLEEIHKKHGMTEHFLYLFEELYAMELEKGTLPQEQGNWKKVRVAQVLHNLKQSCHNNDRSHFGWFMYMMMGFALKEKIEQEHSE